MAYHPLLRLLTQRRKSHTAPRREWDGNGGISGSSLGRRGSLARLYADVVLDLLHALHVARQLNRPVDLLLTIHEAAQLDDALERFHLDLHRADYRVFGEFCFHLCR